MKLITKAIAAELMAADARVMETGSGADSVVLKLFTPWAGCTWYITSGTPLDADGAPMPAELVDAITPADWHLFGFCDLGDPAFAELGYVSLAELEAFKGPAGLTIERDMYYSGEPLAAVLERYGKAA